MAFDRNFEPPKPVGTGPFITFCQWVWTRLRVPYVDTETVKWQVTPRGISARALTRGVADSPASGGGVNRYTLVSVASTYLTCVDPVTNTVVNIAKPMHLRNPASAVVDTITITYVYPTTVERDAYAAGAWVETQIVLPNYVVGDDIFAADVPTSNVAVNGTDIPRIDINADGRAWARKYV